MEEKKELLLKLLAVLTLLDLIVWPFKTQSALFFTIFVLIPLWALWVWFYVPEEESEQQKKPEGESSA